MLVAHESVHATSGQSDPWKRTMAVFKDAGAVVTTPSSGTYVIECIGNVGVLADMIGARVREVGGDDAVRRCVRQLRKVRWAEHGRYAASRLLKGATRSGRVESAAGAARAVATLDRFRANAAQMFVDALLEETAVLAGIDDARKRAVRAAARRARPRARRSVRRAARPGDHSVRAALHAVGRGIRGNGRRRFGTERSRTGGARRVFRKTRPRPRRARDARRVPPSFCAGRFRSGGFEKRHEKRGRESKRKG